MRHGRLSVRLPAPLSGDSGHQLEPAVHMQGTAVLTILTAEMSLLLQTRIPADHFIALCRGFQKGPSALP